MSNTLCHFAGPGTPLLAATAGAGDVLVLFVWFVLAAIVALSGFYIAVVIRRWSQREVRATTFTFQDLRDMRARGQINDREFGAMRTALLAELELDEQADTAPAEEPPPSPPGDAPPAEPGPPTPEA